MSKEEYPKLYLYRRIVQAKLYIDEHLAGKLDLDNISDEASFSKYHFIRLFKKFYGKTPHQYLIAVRIEKAMKLLKEGTAVTDVCYAVGFESPGSFSSLFKRIKGTTATDYMLKEQKLKERAQHSPLTFIPGCFAEKRGWLKNSNFG